MLRKWLAQGAATEAEWLAPALGALDWLLDGPARRVWCIANADDAPISDVLAGLAPGDVVAFYNTCRHAAAFADRRAPALVFFHASDRPGLVHGLHPDGRPTADLSGFPPPSRACVLKPDPASGAGTRVAAGMPSFELETARLAALLCRPEPAALPSAGFASVLLLALLNLRRGMAALAPHRIVLCGFSGHYAGAGYMGHDFQLEQATYARLPNLERLGGGPPPAPSRLHHDLADVFHAGYNGHSRPKAGMLFDVARLAYAAGDIPRFVGLTRQSLAINPGFGETQWLLRALARLRDAGEAVPGLEALVADLDTVKARWSEGSRRDGFGGASFRADVDHPQAQYAVPSGERPAVLIVNETSKMPFNRSHLGCDLVSRTLVDRLAAHGVAAAGWANGLTGVARILAHDPEARFAGVVLNGEGTLHDDADRAFELLTIARHFKAAGKPVFLVNSVWQAMGPTMTGFLADFDLVAVRESASRDAVARVRGDVRVVPDLCWLADLPAGEARLSCAVLDCVAPASTARLEAAAIAGGAPFYVMDRFFDAFHRILAGGAAPGAAPRPLRRTDIRAAARWVGGRFHGTVLALAAGVPMLSLPSNTAKTDAMLGDIGLSGKMLDPADLDRISGADGLAALFFGARDFTGGDWQKVADHRALAAREIDATFAAIAAALPRP